MKICPIITFVLFAHIALGQSEKKDLIQAGLYYSLVIDKVLKEPGFDTINLPQHNAGISGLISISDRLQVGVEYILTIVKPSDKSESYSTLGLVLDYNIVNSSLHALEVRLGLSSSDILFAGEGVPSRQWIINRIIGLSYSFRVKQPFWIEAGFYHHFPLNKISQKYGHALPFLGAYVRV